MSAGQVFVLDASVALSWIFEDESHVYSDAVLEAFVNWKAVVPSIWPLEIANALLVAERRKRLKRAKVEQALTLLRLLPITVEETDVFLRIAELLALAREQDLSVYDATYLDLAMRHGLPLATQDDALQAAALRCGVEIFQGRPMEK